YALYDYSGKALSKPMAYRFIPDANDCCVVPAAGAGNTYGIVNRNGEMLCVTDFRNLVNDGKWYWFENSDKEYGWIDMNGDIKIGPLKLDESQSRHSRIDGYPHPFYGAEYSVGTETLVDEQHEYYYFGGCMSVSALKEMTEKDGIYNLNGLAGDKASELGVVMVSPVVNGLAIGLSMYAGKAYVYKVSGKKLVKVNGEYGFTPAFGNDYIRLYAAYALNPGALWRGLR
ncbi:MAG: hypothetical protein K2O56_10460, partial [Muribaculaceae bacterium]|nr:hypothetical protein [Muribaculaceae bacterium]